jgi:hypothetical protein
MRVWTEEASFAQSPSEGSATRSAVPEALSIAGVPWVTLLLLLSCVWILVAAGGVRVALGLPALLGFGAKATPLILDRGETWRLFAANLLHKDPLHLAFNAFALWNVGGALERAVRPADLWRLGDVGRFKELRLEPQQGPRVRGVIDGDNRQVQLGAACVQREGAQVALVVLQPLRGSATPLDRMAGTISSPGAPKK